MHTSGEPEGSSHMIQLVDFHFRRCRVFFLWIWKYDVYYHAVSLNNHIYWFYITFRWLYIAIYLRGERHLYDALLFQIGRLFSFSPFPRTFIGTRSSMKVYTFMWNIRRLVNDILCYWVLFNNGYREKPSKSSCKLCPKCGRVVYKPITTFHYSRVFYENIDSF